MGVHAFTISSRNFSPAGLFGSLGDLMSAIVQIMIGLSAILCIIFIIVGGYKFITSGGDPKKLESARMTIFYALVGIAVVILAFIILQVVQYFLESSVPVTG